jgi:DNA-binding winged helix-turn-helix (wHTH) protein
MTMPMTSSSALSVRSSALGEVPGCSRFLCFGPFQVDLQREELIREGKRMRVPSKVYQVLLALLEKPGEVVTREDIRARLWPEGTFVNYDANVNTTVNKLRLALDDSPVQPIYVETIPRQGYCFVGSVERRADLKQANGASLESTRSAQSSAASPATASSTRESFSGRLPGFFANGWAAVLLLCGVLIGMGIVLMTHRSN